VETFRDGRKERLGEFVYGPRESPDYVEYMPEIFTLLDMLFETPRGSADAIRLARLAREKLWSIGSEQDPSLPTADPSLLLED
jgi:hypothetical protein